MLNNKIESDIIVNQDITLTKIEIVDNPISHLYGYIVFETCVDGYGLESLFRIYDPSSGNPMTIVSIDYGYLHKDKLDPAWESIRTALEKKSSTVLEPIVKQHKEIMPDIFLRKEYFENE